MQIRGHSFRSLLRNYEVINIAWQTFLSKTRGLRSQKYRQAEGSSRHVPG